MNINEIIAVIKAGPNDITLYPGASQELIEEFQTKTGIELPFELQEFYKECNGFESEEDLFRIIPLDEALETRSRDISDYRLKSNQFYIAEYLVYCDMWTMEIDLNQPSSYKILGGTDGALPIVLTNVFTEFLNRFLTGGVFNDRGLYKWGEEALSKRDKSE